MTSALHSCRPLTVCVGTEAICLHRALLKRGADSLPYDQPLPVHLLSGYVFLCPVFISSVYRYHIVDNSVIGFQYVCCQLLNTITTFRKGRTRKTF